MSRHQGSDRIVRPDIDVPVLSLRLANDLRASGVLLDRAIRLRDLQHSSNHQQGAGGRRSAVTLIHLSHTCGYVRGLDRLHEPAVEDRLHMAFVDTSVVDLARRIHYQGAEPPFGQFPEEDFPSTRVHVLTAGPVRLHSSAITVSVSLLGKGPAPLPAVRVDPHRQVALALAMPSGLHPHLGTVLALDRAPPQIL